MGHPIYHLETKIEHCSVRIRLNDLTVVTLATTGDQPEWFAPPLNPYLVGEENMLEIDVTPIPNQDGSPGDFSKVVVEGAVRRYEKGEPVAPGSGPVALELAVMAELPQRLEDARDRGEEPEIPQVFYFVFDNEGPDFSQELGEADPYADEAALRDYAIRLRDLMRARDASALATEMQPKVQAYAAAYDDDAGRIGESLREVLQAHYVPRGLETEFERDDVELVACCGGRLWELRRPGGLPLMQTPADADGGTMQIPILVAPRDGTLRVVR
ncbi:MAG: hypothetical protein K8H88_14510 [Sandaracinaceae bacterium]|nr:hypothetical protein [Sandaracinaceae bacterium]